MRTLLLVSLVAACSMYSGYEEIDTSLSAWEDVRNNAPDGYSYVRYTNAFDGDPREETTVYVDGDGNVVKRNWKSLDENGDIIEFWEEEEADLGTHDGADPAVPMESLYDECVEIFDTGRDAIVFETFSDGVLRDCFYGDDGVFGVRLLEITIEDNSCIGGIVGRPCG